MIFLIIFGSLFLILLIAYFIISYMIFKKSFKRGISKNLLDVDLSNTHYAPYVDILYPAIRHMMEEEYTEIKIKAFDGIELYARFFDRKSDVTVIMSHGYRAIPYNNFSFSGNYFLERGYNVLFIYHRGHIYTEGKYITMSYLESNDINSWVRYVENNISKKIILYGTSMGGASVTISQIEEKHDSVKFIINDCGIDYSYNAINNALKKGHMPGFIFIPLVHLMAKIKGFGVYGKNLNKMIKDLDTPILFIHSKLDSTVDYNVSINLSKKCKSYSDVILTENGGHTTSFMASPSIVSKKIEEFIDKYIK